MQKSVTLVDSADMWHFQLQHLLAKEYVKYLMFLGLDVVEVLNDLEGEMESFLPKHQRRSGNALT